MLVFFFFFKYHSMHGHPNCDKVIRYLAHWLEVYVICSKWDTTQHSKHWYEVTILWAHVRHDNCIHIRLSGSVSVSVSFLLSVFARRKGNSSQMYQHPTFANKHKRHQIQINSSTLPRGASCGSTPPPLTANEWGTLLIPGGPFSFIALHQDMS